MTTPAAPQPININLTEINARYSAGIQKLFDIAAVTVGSLRGQTEKDYDEFVRTAGYLPNGQAHMKHGEAKQISEQFLVRQLLIEGLNMLTPLLEDVRSVAALAEWKSKDESDQAKVRTILGEEREESLKANLGERIKLLRDKYGIFSQLEVVLPGFFQLTNILGQHGGKVPKEMLGNSGEWILGIAGLNVTRADGQSQPNAQLARVERRFPLEATVSLSKEDVLLIIGSLGFYATTLIGALQQFVQKTLPGQA